MAFVRGKKGDPKDKDGDEPWSLSKPTAEPAVRDTVLGLVRGFVGLSLASVEAGGARSRAPRRTASTSPSSSLRGVGKPRRTARRRRRGRSRSAGSSRARARCTCVARPARPSTRGCSRSTTTTSRSSARRRRTFAEKKPEPPAPETPAMEPGEPRPPSRPPRPLRPRRRTLPRWDEAPAAPPAGHGGGAAAARAMGEAPPAPAPTPRPRPRDGGGSARAGSGAGCARRPEGTRSAEVAEPASRKGVRVRPRAFAVS